MKNSTIIFFFLILSYTISAQPINTLVGDVVMPPPDVASFARHSEIAPGDLSTGVPNISKDLFVMQEKHLSFPISLSWQPSKVGTSDWTGNWTLAQAKITRTVMGIPDEWEHGFWNTGANLYNNFYGEPVDASTTFPLSASHAIVNAIQDGEPDLFSYSLPGTGYSGKFFYGLDENEEPAITLIPQQDVRIEYTLDNTLADNKRLIRFTIITPDGTKYHFGKHETQDAISYTFSTGPYGDGADLLATAWHLIEIQSADNVHSIDFTWQADNYEYYALASENRIFYHGTGSIQPSNPSSYTWGTVSNFNYGWQLATISTRTETATFFATANRQDTGPLGGNIGLKLNNIELSTGTFCRNFHLNYDYATSIPSPTEPWEQKLRLRSIQQKSCDETEIIPPCNFVYTSDFVPSVLSHGIDHWGYYNGHDENLSGIPLMTLSVSGTSRTAGSADRTVNETAMLDGILKRIEHPEGGWTEYTFEKNQYRDNQTQQNKDAGGLRIKQIIKSDGNDFAKNIVRTYHYETVDNPTHSSGVLHEEPEYGRTYEFNINDANVSYTTHDGCTDGLHGGAKVFIFNSFPNLPLSSYDGYHIHYTSVREDYQGIGHKVYQYSAPDAVPYPPIYTYPQAPEQIRLRAGKPTAQSSYTETNLINPVHTDSYDGNVFYAQSEQRFLKAQAQVISGTFSTFNCVSPTIQMVSYETTLYPIFTGRYELTNTTTLLDGVSSSMDYEYNSNEHYFKTAESLTNSDGKIHRTEYFYTDDADWATGTEANAISNMDVANIRGIPLRTIQKVDGVQVRGTWVKYKQYFGHYATLYPWEFYDYEKAFDAANEPTGSGIWVKRGEVTQRYAGTGLPQTFIQTGWQPETYIWNTNNRLIQSRSYGNFTWTYNYIPNTKLPEQIIDIDGQIVTFDYDELTRLESITEREGLVQKEIEYLYGSEQNAIITNTTFTDNTPQQTSEQVFDGLGRAIYTILNGVIKEEVRYDKYGRTKQQTYLPGNFTTFGYDDSPLMRIKTQTYPDGNSTTRNYVSEGNYFKTTLTDENGNTTATLSDILGRPHIERNALGDETNWKHDDRNRLIEISPPKSSGFLDPLNFYFDYDTRDRVVSKTIPDGGTKTFTYEPTRDLLRTSTDAKGTLLYYEYDQYGRQTISRRGGMSGVLIAENRYDNDGITPTDPINIGRLNQSKTLVLDAAETDYLTTNYVYDTYGRLFQTNKNNYIGGTEQMTNTYNDADWMSQNQRLHSSNATYGNENLNIVQDYEYDNFGRPTKTSYNINGATTTLCTQIWNDRDQLVNKTLGGEIGDGLQSLDYLYNERGWLRQINQLLDLFSPSINPNNCDEQSELSSNDSEMMAETFCGSVIADLPELLSIRFNPNVNIDCYNPCTTSPMIAGEPANCPSSFGSGNLSSSTSYTQTVQLPCVGGGTEAVIRPDFSSFPLPTSLYRLRFCDGSEAYVFHEDLPSDMGDYVILQIIEINSLNQLFSFSKGCGNQQYVGLDALVVALENSENIAISDYILTDGVCTPQAPNCSDDTQQQQQGYITSLKQNPQDEDDFNYPFYLIRVLLCDGSEVYLTPEELQNLPGQYIELQRIFIENQEQIFQVGSTISSTDTKDLFYLSLHYDDVDGTIGNTIQKNGNISYMTWQTAGRTEQLYKFAYDPLNRIQSATFGEKFIGATIYNDLYSTTYGNYDANGNIGSITRMGPEMMLDGTYECGVEIDKLVINYSGNRINNISDQVSDATNRLRGFKAANANILDYGYDNNGNLIDDPHKGLDIAYNYLNLPKLFEFDSGNDHKIGIVYTSDGQKLQKAVTGDEAILKDYCEGVEYENRDLKAVYHEEGRVVRNGGLWDFEWFIRDNLGSNRVVFKEGVDRLVVLNEENHYPFGMQMNGAWNQQTDPEQNYLYNGKELNGDFGLNWSDYGARWYDPAIARWNAVDPLAESYMSWSPYNYVLGNPIRFTDPDGRSVEGDLYNNNGVHIGNDGIDDDKVYVKDTDNNNQLSQEETLAETQQAGIMVIPEPVTDLTGETGITHTEFEQFGANVYNEAPYESSAERDRVASAINNRKETSSQGGTWERTLDKIMFNKDNHDSKMSPQRAKPKKGAKISGTNIKAKNVKTDNYQDYHNATPEQRNNNTGMRDATRATISGLRGPDKANGANSWRGRGQGRGNKFFKEKK